MSGSTLNITLQIILELDQWRVNNKQVGLFEDGGKSNEFQVVGIKREEFEYAIKKEKMFKSYMGGKKEVEEEKRGRKKREREKEKRMKN